MELNPQLKSLSSLSNSETVQKSNLLAEDPQLVAKMQAEAQLTKQKCQNYLTE